MRSESCVTAADLAKKINLFDAILLLDMVRENVEVASISNWCVKASWKMEPNEEPPVESTEDILVSNGSWEMVGEC